ncbi:MAG: sulfate transporter CysZ [Gammaproteobacteria bacterium]|nr:sulfate transporter CysZ [Gammaproteobacteria bacterium]
MKDLFLGVAFLLEGLRLIRLPGLRRYVLIPLLINVLLFGGALYFAFGWVASLVEMLLAYLPAYLDWLSYLLWPLFALVSLVVVFFSFTMLANFIGAPFNDLLAAAVERQLTGRAQEDSDWKTLLRELLPNLLSELRKLLYFVLRAIPLGILFLIPGLNLAAPFLWALFAAWMMALEYTGYPMANRGLLFPQQRRWLREHRGLSLGFGGATLLGTLIPVVNFLVMPAAVAGATAMWVKKTQT